MKLRLFTTSQPDHQSDVVASQLLFMTDKTEMNQDLRTLVSRFMTWVPGPRAFLGWNSSWAPKGFDS
ncbi:hypothetical protein T265_08263 [Opisthorchis viverrini]|uniref:Uncharacterized protein n=1 Tax=Opisthorchis viverrini TaxID=6198 RepID=A0A074ZE84_OPIVI|nr:hypothetical protein T265_08263 [Opisthorchis viverrini]KER23967.1 hypothetical protein T265_08263 [Opisthorchis viverrini]